MISIDVKEKLFRLGLRLRDCRLVRNEPQERFAARLGISIPTLRKMENGDPSVNIGLWAETLWLLERMEDLDGILKKDVSLFDQMEAQSKPKRQRASKRTC
ncbi:MAG: helix-turn-helix domain-containing protein [Deltaproteobacteria bacterium]|nr:helix-turn-helix domain-containing protein [Deltaproteobacteria bacterium]